MTQGTRRLAACELARDQLRTRQSRAERQLHLPSGKHTTALELTALILCPGARDRDEL
jgi:hypothetical protein